MRLWSLAGSVALVTVAWACDEKKSPPPAASAASSASLPSPTTASDPSIVAYPPGYVPPEDAGVEAGPPQPKTGVCSFQESGYDGQDTKSNEKIVVKIKDDKVVAAEYTYRGSHAVDGKIDTLSVPVREGEWLEFELPLVSGGHKTFKLKIKGNDIDFKGVAGPGAQGSCTWVKPAEEEPDAGAKDKADKKSKKPPKSGK